MLLFLADAVEYGQWKLGRRNESVSFAVQPFINKLGGAVGTGVVTFTLIISGINDVSAQVASMDAVTQAAEIAALIDGIAPGQIWVMKAFMMLLPLACILVGFVIYYKKFKIDEELYAQIIAELAER